MAVIPLRAGAVSSVSLTEFARDNSVALTRFAYLVCGERGLAEDLVQDVFLAMYRRFGEHLPLDAPVAYARRAIVNGAVSHHRRRIPSVTAAGEVPDRPVDAAFPAAEDAMWRTLATLPDRQRVVLVLRYYYDLPDREIAALVDAREGTVRSLAARAFATLRGRPELAAEGGVR